jgi:rubrerythrin
MSEVINSMKDPKNNPAASCGAEKTLSALLSEGLKPENVFTETLGPIGVGRILKTRLGEIGPALPGPHWSAEALGFTRSAVFRQMSEVEQKRVLQVVSDMRIGTTSVIERAGIAYCAKMALLSRDQETRDAYMVMGHDEVRHFHELRRFRSSAMEMDPRSQPMIACLKDGIEKGGWATGVFVLQVLLEGFGIWFYSLLMETASTPELKQAFQSIIRDEASHHGLGCALLEQASPSAEERASIVELTGRFIAALNDETAMIQCFGWARGRALDASESEEVIEGMGMRRNAVERLARLRQLVERHDRWGVVKDLEARGVFG